jgi:inositol oxygenase
MNDKDNQILKDVLNFNKYDLYSKNDDTYISPDVKKYYTDLLKTFFPEPLQW